MLTRELLEGLHFFKIHAPGSGSFRHAPGSQDGRKYGGEWTAVEAVEEARHGGSERLPYFSGGLWGLVTGLHPRRFGAVQDLRQDVFVQHVQAYLVAASVVAVPSPDSLADRIPCWRPHRRRQ